MFFSLIFSETNGTTGFMMEVLVSLIFCCFFTFSIFSFELAIFKIFFSALLHNFFLDGLQDQPTRKRFFVAWAAVCKDMRAYWRQRRNENSRRYLDSRSKVQG